MDSQMLYLPRYTITDLERLYSVYTGSSNRSNRVINYVYTITIKSNWRQILKFMYKMAAFISCGSCGTRVLFLVLEQQIKVLRFQPAAFTFAATQKVEAKAIEFASNAIRKTRHLRRAWSWPRNQFWFETVLQGNFVKDCWKENI